MGVENQRANFTPSTRANKEDRYSFLLIAFFTLLVIVRLCTFAGKKEMEYN